jgi:UDP-N-acetylmuramate--alanine ligase
MAGLAHIVGDAGVHVSGTDAAWSPMLERLEWRGFAVAVGHSADRVAGADLVVYSNAIPATNPELVRAVELGIPTMLRGRFLAEVARFFDCVVSVGGSHGKTTTTAMLAHILLAHGIDAGYLVGGQVNGWTRSARAGDGGILVTEVDESDGTQSLMDSSIAVVTNVEDDHCWSVGGLDGLYACFAEFAARAERVVTWSTGTTCALVREHACAEILGGVDIPAELSLPMGGLHNRMNATLAVRAAAHLGVPYDSGIGALASFPGVSRRLTERFRCDFAGLRLVEDYAHHPTELNAALASVRDGASGGALWVVFQPHRYERVRRYAAAFGHALSAADRVWVVGPFAAWLADEGLADPRAVLESIDPGTPHTYHEGTLASLAADISEKVSQHEGGLVIAVIGAGDVTSIVPPLCASLSGHCLERLSELVAARFPGRAVARTRDWAALTTLGVGGARPLVAQPSTMAELQQLCAWAHSIGVSVEALGAGSNLVGTDREPPRIWVQLVRGEFVTLSASDDGVSAGAGVCLYPLFRELAERGCGIPRASWLAWVPGTLGGAVRMNAGAGGLTIGELVLRVDGVRSDGMRWTCLGSEVEWGYRRSGIPADVIVTRVRLRTGNESSAEGLRRIVDAGKERGTTQPPGRSAGCVFRNPRGRSAGMLIDRAGCKGWNEGGAHISNKHANFLVIEPGEQAAEADVVALMRRVQFAVFRHSGIVLEPEVRFAGPDSEERMRTQTQALTAQCDSSGRGD